MIVPQTAEGNAKQANLQSKHVVDERNLLKVIEETPPSRLFIMISPRTYAVLFAHPLPNLHSLV